MMPTRLLTALPVMAVFLGSAAFAVAGEDSVRQEFVAAMHRIHQHVAEAPDSPGLEAFLLHDYLVAARLRRDLTVNPNPDLDTTIDTFLRVHAGQPVGHALRHEWLANLAARKRWDWFLSRSADTTEPSLICDRLTGRLATQDTAGLAEDALARWRLPQRQPDECNEVFAWLRSRGLLTAALAESRTRALLGADNAHSARESVADVPAERSGPLLQWIQLLEAPKAALALLAINPRTPVEPDALVAGFSHLSYSDSTAALALLPALSQRSDMTPELQSRLRRAAALGAAYARAPTAVAAFSGLAVDPNDSLIQEWRVRAALWAGDYAKALEWTEQMPVNLSATPRWRYWHARAVAAMSGTAAAAQWYAQIAGLRDYYGYLAADQLNQRYNLNIHPSPDDVAAQSVLGEDPGLARAHALFDCDMLDDAAAEWAAVLGSAKPAVKVQAAHLATRWGWYAQTIATLAQAGEWDDVPLRYPRPFAAIVADAGKEARVADDFLFAIMRQESLFRKDAVSRADARGLMQMQPATATAVAHRWHLPVPSRDGLFEPTVAVKLGALYVRELMDRNGQLALALAAYNAGPASVARWLPPDSLDADIWIENIPYTETRSYVQHILEHIVAFATLRNAAPPKLSVLLPKIAP